VTDRFLANENFPAEIVRFLRERGDDAAHAAETMVAAPDAEIVRAAVREDRVLLTFDRDFGELVFRFKEPPAPGVVLFRGADVGCQKNAPPDSLQVVAWSTDTDPYRSNLKATDPAAFQNNISRLFFGDQQTLNFAVTPVAPNGTGTGEISVDYAEVVVKYRQQ